MKKILVILFILVFSNNVYANKKDITNLNFKPSVHKGKIGKAYEIVKVVSDQTVEIRRMDTEVDDSVKLKWVSGGFAGHCVNQRDQKWFYKSNPDNPVIRIRRRKDGNFYRGYNIRFSLDFKPYHFYDYNF